MVKAQRVQARESAARGQFQGRYNQQRKRTTTAIPSRASVYAAHGVSVRPRYTSVAESRSHQMDDITRIPTLPRPGPIWQYETPGYEAESSLASLSLALSEALTYEQQAIQKDEPDVSEEDTRPERFNARVNRQFFRDIAEIDTTPPPALTFPAAGQQDQNGEQCKRSVRETAISDITYTSARTDTPFYTIKLGLWDSVQRWLLHPGHLEFSIWIVGTILLIAITGLLAIVLSVSLGWLVVRH